MFGGCIRRVWDLGLKDKVIYRVCRDLGSLQRGHTEVI